MEALKFVILFETVLIFAAAFATFLFSAKILFYKQLYKGTLVTSLTLVISLWYQLLWGAFTVIYCIFIIVFWRPDTTIYNQKALFIIGFPTWIFLLLNNIIEAFLAVDRCLCIIFPIKYKQSFKKLFGFITFISVIAYALMDILTNNLWQIFLLEEIPTNCEHISCIFIAFNPPYIYMQKLVPVFVTAVLGILLFILMKKFLTNINSKSQKEMHKTVIFVIAATTFFEFFPNIMAQIFKAITNENLATYLGPYSVCLVSGNVAVCSWTYYRTLNNSFKKPSDFVSTVAGIRKTKFTSNS